MAAIENLNALLFMVDFTPYKMY